MHDYNDCLLVIDLLNEHQGMGAVALKARAAREGMSLSTLKAALTTLQREGQVCQSRLGIYYAI